MFTSGCVYLCLHLGLCWFFLGLLLVFPWFHVYICLCYFINFVCVFLLHESHLLYVLIILYYIFAFIFFEFCTCLCVLFVCICAWYEFVFVFFFVLVSVCMYRCTLWPLWTLDMIRDPAGVSEQGAPSTEELMESCAWSWFLLYPVIGFGLGEEMAVGERLRSLGVNEMCCAKAKHTHTHTDCYCAVQWTPNTHTRLHTNTDKCKITVFMSSLYPHMCFQIIF